MALNKIIKVLSYSLMLVFPAVQLATSTGLSRELVSGQWINEVIHSGISDFSITFSYRITENCELVDATVVATDPEELISRIPNNYPLRVLKKIIGPFETQNFIPKTELIQADDESQMELSYTPVIEKFRYFHVKNDDGTQATIQCQIVNDKVTDVVKKNHSDFKSAQNQFFSVEDFIQTNTRYEEIEYSFID